MTTGEITSIAGDSGCQEHDVLPRAAAETHVLFLATMALAASIIISCEILFPKAFQDRHPIGGLRARWYWDRSVSCNRRNRRARVGAGASPSTMTSAGLTSGAGRQMVVGENGSMRARFRAGPCFRGGSIDWLAS